MKQTLPAPTHHLGGEHAAVRRISDAADRVIGQAPSARVSLRVLGEALAAPTGGRFDDTDPDDRALLARALTVLGLRFHRFGFEVRDVPADPTPGALVLVCRRPRAGGVRALDRMASWADVAPRAVLARWADRAPETDADGPDDQAEPGDPDGDDTDGADEPVSFLGRPGPGDWDVVARIRAFELAAGRPWPPKIRLGGERAEREDPDEADTRRRWSGARS